MPSSGLEINRETQRMLVAYTHKDEEIWVDYSWRADSLKSYLRRGPNAIACFNEQDIKDWIPELSPKAKSMKKQKERMKALWIEQFGEPEKPSKSGKPAKSSKPKRKRSNSPAPAKSIKSVKSQSQMMKNREKPTETPKNTNKSSKHLIGLLSNASLALGRDDKFAIAQVIKEYTGSQPPRIVIRQMREFLGSAGEGFSPFQSLDWIKWRREISEDAEPPHAEEEDGIVLNNTLQMDNNQTNRQTLFNEQNPTDRFAKTSLAPSQPGTPSKPPSLFLSPDLRDAIRQMSLAREGR